jgi:hypothetical protein
MPTPSPHNAAGLTADEYDDRVDGLEAMGVPERRAEAVALRDAELTYQEIADALGLSARADARAHVVAYCEQYHDAERLLEDGPHPDDL